MITGGVRVGTLTVAVVASVSPATSVTVIVITFGPVWLQSKVDWLSVIVSMPQLSLLPSLTKLAVYSYRAAAPRYTVVSRLTATGSVTSARRDRERAAVCIPAGIRSHQFYCLDRTVTADHRRGNRILGNYNPGTVIRRYAPRVVRQGELAKTIDIFDRIRRTGDHR